jgi:hypothetical protein
MQKVLKFIYTILIQVHFSQNNYARLFKKDK